MRTSTRLVAAAVPLVLALSACGGSDPYADKGGGSGGEGDIVIGSADFPESTLLANIYAQALKAKDIGVETQFNIGSREVYYDQIEAGKLTVFPEYNGATLAYLDPEAAPGTTEETNKALKEELPKGLEILDSSKAENKDSVTVTRETAEKEDLKTLEDLKGSGGDMVLGGPPEFAKRTQGVPGLKDEYGIEFKDFRSLDVNLLPQALKDGDIQAANLFTTDAAIIAEDFVALEDPKNLFGAQNVTPLVFSEKVDDDARGVLNDVSAKLTTDTLAELNEKVVLEREGADKVAEEWLKSVELV